MKKTLLLCICIGLFTINAFAQPANDSIDHLVFSAHGKATFKLYGGNGGVIAEQGYNPRPIIITKAKLMEICKNQQFCGFAVWASDEPGLDWQNYGQMIGTFFIDTNRMIFNRVTNTSRIGHHIECYIVWTKNPDGRFGDKNEGAIYAS